VAIIEGLNHKYSEEAEDNHGGEYLNVVFSYSI
jgi:hypothetical protein